MATGTLEDGFETQEWVCLADGCYELVVSGGSASSEIGFEFIDEVRSCASADASLVEATACDECARVYC